MRYIKLHQDDFEMFSIDLIPPLVEFFVRHKDAFRQMKIDQGLEFWTRFVISFRTFSTNHGIIREVPLQGDKMDGYYDQGFIVIHEEFVEAKPNIAKNFINNVFLVARNQHNFPNVDGKIPKAHDLFYTKETREVFRRFFGSPEDKESYIRLYVLSRILIRFGGAVCICLKRWLDAEPMDPSDMSYWTPPRLHAKSVKPINKMCDLCFEQLTHACFKERVNGHPSGPRWLVEWQHGDPRNNEPRNPLYDSKADLSTDWRDNLDLNRFNKFFQFVQRTQTRKFMNAYGLLVDCDCDNFKREHERRTDFSNIFIMEATERKMPNLSLSFLKEICEGKKVPGSSGSKNSRLVDDHELNMAIEELCGPDDTDDGLCEVFRVVDSATGGMEIVITTSCNKTCSDGWELYSHGHAEFPFNEHFLRRKFDNGLPKMFKWYEMSGSVSATFDYTEEEKRKTEKPTNFKLIMMCEDEARLKWLMIHMMSYVHKVKKRPSLGWVMKEDDILVNMLAYLKPALWKGICIHIQQGVDIQGLLPDESRHRPYIHSTRNAGKIYGMNPVPKDTWIRSEDGSLKLKNTVPNKPMELKELKRTVGGILRTVQGLYRKKKSVMNQEFHRLSIQELPRDSKFMLIDELQTAMLKKYGSLCRDSIAESTHKFIGNSELDIQKCCLEAVKKVRDTILNNISEIKTNYKEKEKLVSFGTVNFIDSLQEYSRGIVLRTRYSEELASDEEEEASETVINALFPNQIKGKCTATPCKKSHHCQNCHRRMQNQCTHHIHGAKDGKVNVSCQTKFHQGSAPKTIHGTNAAQNGLKGSRPVQVEVTVENGPGPKGQHRSTETKSTTTFDGEPKSAETKSTAPIIFTAKPKSAETKSTAPTAFAGRPKSAEARSASPTAFAGRPRSADTKSTAPIVFAGKPRAAESISASLTNGEVETADKKTKDVKFTEAEKRCIERVKTMSLAFCQTINKDRAAWQNTDVSMEMHVEHLVNGNDKENESRNLKTNVSQMADEEGVMFAEQLENTVDSKPKSKKGKKKTQAATNGGNEMKGIGEGQEIKTDIQNEKEESKPETSMAGKSVASKDEDGSMKTEIAQDESNKQNKGDKKLRTCAKCGDEEPYPKKFKKCQKCREEKVENARYYCGRQCQVAHWGERHKEEHKTNSFP